MVIIFLSEKMNTEILGVALQILLLLVISYPLGKHIAKVYKDGNDCMRFMAPLKDLFTNWRVSTPMKRWIGRHS